MEIRKLQQEKSMLFEELSTAKDSAASDRIYTRLKEVDAKIKELLFNRLTNKLEAGLKLQHGWIDDFAYKNPNTTAAIDTFNKEEFQKVVEKAATIIANRELLKSIPDYGLLKLVTELITEYKDRADRSMLKEEKLEYLKKYLTNVL